MPFRRELGHVRTDLCQNACRSILFDSGNGLQQFKCRPELGLLDSRQDLLVNFLKLLFQKHEVIEAEPEQQPVVVIQPIAFE